MATEATGFVVAGGRSRRMGRDKALLPWHGKTLLDHAVERLAGLCGRIFVLCGREPRYQDRGRPVIVDPVRDAGPLAGIVAGLRVLEDEPGLFLAVDLPQVPAALLGHLLDRAEGWDAVVPVSPGGPEPLCAVYTRACLQPAEHRLAAGELKMTSFWGDVRVREVGLDELRRFGEPSLIFRNINSPRDLT